MYLKRLEVIGFKSFAERIGIDFVPGVTAVVGPNGSGKSNVTDAIRWVLGEQSAKSLRGAKMEDIIFAGSESRKALNFAEVTLILDNEDERLPISYNEVSVTRRVYRSGESEYLLNKQTCRLKDITDLFLDSGLGKEAFSIISQGRVDEILNSKPDDRRAIFEEAAGVLKYKKRRKKAEHKLFETDDNLNRVLDILHELDERIEPLQLQASTAKDYLEMKDTLRQFDIGVLIHDIEQIDHTVAKLLQDQHQWNTSQQEKLVEIQKLEQHIASMKDELLQVGQKLDADQKTVVEVSENYARLQGEQNLFAEKQKNASAQLSKLKESLKQAQAKRDQWQKSLIEKEHALKEAQNHVHKLRKHVKQLETDLNRSTDELDAEIEDQKSTYIERLNEQAATNNELKSIEQQIQQQRQSDEKITSKSSELTAELQQAQATLAEVEPKLDAIRLEIAEHLKDYEATQAELQKANTQLAEKQKMLYEGYNHVQQLRSRRDTLAELEADFAGFYQGVKAVLKAREQNQLQGVQGAVAELIHAKGAYTQAIETALGAAMQHIVTATDEDAKRAIRYLKQVRAGRATFLPMNIMKSRKLSKAALQPILDHPSFIQTADELVQVDERYRSIAENLLGHILVVKDLDGATQIAKFLQYRYRVVTLDGDVVNAGGSMSGGGANKQQNTVFSRKAELETLQANLVEMEATIQQAEKVVAEWQQKAQSAATLLDVQRDHGEQLRVQENELEATYQATVTQEKMLQQSLSIYGSEQQDTTSRHAMLVTKQETLVQQLDQTAKEIQHLEQEIERLNELKVQMKTARDTLLNELANQREDHAQAMGKFESIQTSTEETRSYFNEAAEEVSKIRREIEFVTKGDVTTGLSEEQFEQEIAKQLKRKQQLETAIEQSVEKRANLQQRVDEETTTLKEMQRIHQQFVNEQNQVKIQLGKLEVKRANAVEQLQQNYDLTFEEAQLEPALEVDLEVAKRKVNMLSQSIKELGDVNISAIEEYEAVAERHEFLTSQRNDLLEAKDTLYEAIREMDEEMTTRFGTTFKQIRIHFQEVFKELFGGGKADLILLEPDQLLTSGIEIVAQPPGKKLQNLGLLSGGERALTAIALLFAILRTRPVPFCILDEVEAALDEANVSRYSQYLKKFSEDTQFIVITHKKVTMEGADVLYGITMQEQGVSKLVSVKLEQETVS